jgi:membrane protein YdbS with pleckstrin-like domain
MKKWWSIWDGHVFGGIAILLALTCLFMVWQTLRSDETNAIIWNGLAAIIAGVLTLCLLGFAAWHWKDHRERYAIRQGWLVGRSQMPAGGHK